MHHGLRIRSYIGCILILALAFQGTLHGADKKTKSV